MFPSGSLTKAECCHFLTKANFQKWQQSPPAGCRGLLDALRSWDLRAAVGGLVLWGAAVGLFLSGLVPSAVLYQTSSGRWFGTFFIFPYIWNNHPNWLIFLGGVETTNQSLFGFGNYSSVLVATGRGRLFKWTSLCGWGNPGGKAPLVVTLLANAWGFSKIWTPSFQNIAKTSQQAVALRLSRFGFRFGDDISCPSLPSLHTDPSVSKSSLGQPRNNAMSRPGRGRR